MRHLYERDLASFFVPCSPPTRPAGPSATPRLAPGLLAPAAETPVDGPRTAGPRKRGGLLRVGVNSTPLTPRSRGSLAR